MRVVQVSFRTRLLLALLGSVALLLGLTMLIVRMETSRQVASFASQATTRAAEASEQLEQLWQDQLGAAGLRLNSSPRIQAALAEGDPALLTAVAVDELVVATIPDALAVFADLEGEPLTMLLEQRELEDESLFPVDPWFERLAEGEERVFGYHVITERLFVVHATVLTLFQRPLGVLLLGFPVEDQDAHRLAQVLDAEICFVVGSACVAATPGVRGSRLEPLLVQAAGATGSTTQTWERERWALIPQRLSPTGELAAARVIAVPLEPVLAPFDRIRGVASLAGIAALLFAALLATLLSRGLTRPIQALVAATRRIARGEYDVRVAVPVQDEIGALGTAFNSMAEGLLLKEKYRGVLDKVVSEEIAEELLKDEIRLGGETREVTMLFADIRGFTSRTEGMEPQEVIGLLNEYMARVTAAVEAERGVVDKYVGDEVIALFGAPVARPDDPVRAVRAALAIQAAMRELNAERVSRGDLPLELGIGINTGYAVAGNMGTPRRMNYTVIGEAVNLTARLCSAARPGEILISEATFLRVRDSIPARKLPPIRVKGLSYEVQVYAVEIPSDSSAERSSLGAAAGVMGLLAALLVAPNPAPAQQEPASAAEAVPSPHLLRADRGDFAGSIQSAAAPWIQVGFAGRLELEGYLPQDAPVWIIEETEPFVAGRASLFGILNVGDRLSGLVEARADRGHVPADASLQIRLQQGLLHYTIGTPLGLGAQVGKFISPFGAFAQRHRTPADPFIRPPLAHEHRTIVSPIAIPQAIDGFLDWKDEGLPTRQRGAPPVWSVPYPTGAMVLGRLPRADFRVAVLNSAPAGGPREWTPDFGRAPTPSLVAGIGYQPRPELRLGVSYAVGPYLEPVLEDSLPAGSARSDFLQQLWSASVAFSRGLVEAHAELFVNRWDVPNLAQSPRDLAYYAEGKLKLGAGVYVAARYNAMHFNEMGRSSGEREPWDHDVQRWQFGTGYRLTRASELRAEYLLNRSDVPAGAAADLFAVQLWWAF